MGYGNDMNAASELLRQVLNLKKQMLTQFTTKAEKFNLLNEVRQHEFEWKYFRSYTIIFDQTETKIKHSHEIQFSLKLVNYVERI